ncbi:unnamed protein product [Cuscuta epithymum]|uniref:BHLH domain-containing protein n=2 Tax=Cuscuta epithymum TaxID=186058 RepID=A0AAV0C3I4_9ASTE|nr:unnamed protein product [Cuscuta epithymum]
MVDLEVVVFSGLLIGKQFQWQMMAGGNPNNWWSVVVNASNNMEPPPQPAAPSSYQFLQSSSPPSHEQHQHFYGSFNSVGEAQSQDFPRPLSQLLMCGLGGNENEKFGMSHFQYKKAEENWDDEIGLNNNHNPSSSAAASVDNVIKEDDEFDRIAQMYGQDPIPLVLEDHHRRYFQTSTASVASSRNQHQRSTYSKSLQEENRPDASQHSYECNSTSTSTSTGGASKRPRVSHNQASSQQPSLKVRKEKLGDRVTALHQLVSPFGKTDTASVLSEAIGYITFLQSQIQALSTPYLGNASGSMGHVHQQSESVEKGGKDLRSKGLCLVPLECTQLVSVGSCGNIGGDINGGAAADYWPSPNSLGGRRF